MFATCTLSVSAQEDCEKSMIACTNLEECAAAWDSFEESMLNDLTAEGEQLPTFRARERAAHAPVDATSLAAYLAYSSCQATEFLSQECLGAFANDPEGCEASNACTFSESCTARNLEDSCVTTCNPEMEECVELGQGCPEMLEQVTARIGYLYSADHEYAAVVSRARAAECKLPPTQHLIRVRCVCSRAPAWT